MILAVGDAGVEALLATDAPVESGISGTLMKLLSIPMPTC